MAPPAVPQVTAKEFLQAIWGDEQGIAELTIIGSKIRKGGFKVAYPFFYPASVDTFISSALNHNRTDNVYMGVCLRRQPWPYPTGRKNSDGTPEMVKRGNEANALSAFAAWAEFDFAEAGHKGKTIPEEQARKVLREFPLKPSIINRSGGGIQCFWLMKEVITGEKLWHLKAVNRALAKFFGADTQSVDLARVLRIPWTKNHNYDPIRTVEISWWHPENRYILDDFDLLPIEDEKKLVGAPAAPAAVAPDLSAPPVPASSTPKTPAAPAVASAQPLVPDRELTPSQAFAAQAASPEGVPDPIETPTKDLKEDVIDELGRFLGQIWMEGVRHEMALCVAGWFMRQGVIESCTKKVVEIASSINKGDTKKRLKDVEDTYKNRNIKPIMGKKHIHEMIEEKHPEGDVRKAYLKILASINTRLPRTKGHKRDEAPVDFKILHLSKFTSQPARWTITFEKDLNQHAVVCDTSVFAKYETFVSEVLDQTSVALTANLKNHEWRMMIHDATENGLYDEKEAPPDARPSGAIEQGLTEFMSESRENPDVGLLKKFAGHDDENSFFILNTFKDFLEEQGHKFTQHQLTEKLRDMGWNKKVRRFGKKTPNVWFKSILQGGGGNGNGNGNGNGHHPDGPGSPTPAPAAAPAATEPSTLTKDPDDPPSEVSLFPTPEAPDA